MNREGVKHPVKEIAEHVRASVQGDGRVEVTGVSSIASASLGSLVFVEDEKNLRLALGSRAAAVIAGDFALGADASKPLLISSQPRLAFARAAQFLSESLLQQAGVHPSAVVDPSAGLASNVCVGARAVIGAGVAIGDGTRIGAGSVLGSGVSLGKDCQIYPNVTIYPGAHLGDRVIIHAGAVLGSDGFGYVRDKETGRYETFPQIGSLVIEDDVEIGANSAIDRGALEVTRIGRGTKIDNLVHIGHNCQIGEDVVIAAQTGFSGSIVIENNVVLGGRWASGSTRGFVKG